MSDKDFALTCAWCDWRPDQGHPVGLAAAHQEAEHPAELAERREADGPDGKSKLVVVFNLVVVCNRCNGAMAHLATVGDKEHYTCEACRRGKTITKGGR